MVKSKDDCTEKCIQKTPIALMQQTMENIENKIDRLEKTIEDFIKSADQKYVKSETVKLILMASWIIFTIIWAVFAILKIIQPILQ